ncbi:hypothetical protein A2Y99_01375 [Candidatus Gottesmanbacteria bacterium RBG_13_37_7]|uniref:Uncharacterized protein n=1 Tax=Candidatus Gottesmanbacteria bacterium RBG_13_37_7 TaxID=1798369 RepID=A0A1F5YJC3_9BACT|nr:MAG: hypothetical protein A2Y99_01375 [Candidatus Gottesmanbacteria bacterium RBG_13_37_7]
MEYVHPGKGLASASLRGRTIDNGILADVAPPPEGFQVKDGKGYCLRKYSAGCERQVVVGNQQGGPCIRLCRAAPLQEPHHGQLHLIPGAFACCGEPVFAPVPAATAETPVVL